MSASNPQKSNRKQAILNITLAVAAGQVGCATLVIVLVAVLGGLWMDSQLGTRPTFTIILVLISIPVSLLTMLFLARAAVGRIKAQAEPSNITDLED
jgi:F0F1-type ATP synthase assembly protein I